MKEKNITFANQDLIEAYHDLAKDFFDKVLGIDYGGCLVTDKSYLSDFINCKLTDNDYDTIIRQIPHELSRQAKAQAIFQGMFDTLNPRIILSVFEQYGVSISTTQMPIVEILKLIDSKPNTTH